MTSGFLQLESTIYNVDSSCKKTNLDLQQQFYGISRLKLL
jgi:hypothetical protein